jgi:hypothetical protein
MAMPMVSAELVPPLDMPAAPPLVSDAVLPGAKPLHRSLVADSCDVDGTVLLAVVRACPAVALCVVTTPGDATTAPAATGDAATGVAATTELGTTAAGVGVGVAVAAGAARCAGVLALRCTVGTANEGADAVDGAGLLGTAGVGAGACGATTAKDAAAVPPVGFEALIT